MKETLQQTQYKRLHLNALIDLLNKKYAQLALTINNKFNLERKSLELNEQISEIRRLINKKNQEKALAENTKGEKNV